MNKLNNVIVNSSYFERTFKINIFKNSTNYKRFIFGITKFRRKSLIRLKHRTNWLMYTVTIRLWIKDYRFNKNISRFQFFNKIFINNYFFYNFNFIKNRNETIFYNFNFVISMLSKKSYFYFYFNNFNNFNYFKNNNLTFLWFYKAAQLNNLSVPSYAEWHSNFFPNNSQKLNFFDFSIFFDFFSLFIFKKIIEIRKIFVLLFYNNIKILNVK